MNVRTLCLGILTFQDASGYEIKKMVEEEVFSHFIDASYGSIYPALIKMLEEGLVTVRATEQDGKPDKKVYSITGAGRAELAHSLAVDPAKDKFKSEFLFQMLLNEYLSSEHIAAIYDAQIEYLKGEMEHARSCTSEGAGRGENHPGMQFVGGYGMACLEAGLQYLEEHRDEVLAHMAGRRRDAAQ